MDGNTHRPEPSNPHLTVSKKIGSHDFTAGLYPGFASTIHVNGEELYVQSKDGPHPFVLPSGSTKPWSSHAIELTCSKGYNVTLHIDDPNHVVDHIQIKLREPEAAASAGGGVTAYTDPGGGSGGDNVDINNTPTICPPFC